MLRRRRDLRARWRAAQEAELAFWRDWRSVPTFRDFDVAGYWAERFRALGLSAPTAEIRTVVEVGCGPLGGIFFLPNRGLKIGLDPLVGRFPPEVGAHPQASGRVEIVRAVGEALPLPERCADVVICYNVIDHVMNPEAVLDEIRRIVRPSGRVLLMAHTFPAVLCPFLGFDKPHPHHWSFARLLQIIRSRGFRVEDQEQAAIGFPITLRTFFDPRAWKHVAANLLVSSTYIDARPSPP